MDVIIDDGPFLEELIDRPDRPRSHTWPLPDPGLLAVETKPEAEQSPEPCQSHISPSNDSQECIKKYNEGASPRKNNRKNAWGNLSYADLITQAIDSSPEKRLTLSDIYNWMVKNVPYFKDKGDSTSSAGWKNSIRHNLSLHSRFMRVQNDQSGKSSFWVLNPDAKPGKSPRRRSGSVDGPGKAERKRGGGRKKNSAGSPEDLGSNLSPLGSASATSSRNSKKKNQSSDSVGATSPCSSTDSLSNLPDLDENGGSFILTADSFTRPRSTSNVSTHSSVGRLTPIPGEELEDDFASLSDADNFIVASRPRGASDAEATASLVESLTLGRQTDTINLDESLKFESNMMNGTRGYGEDTVRPHSDSFSSVQSGDSGYESPASYFVTSAGQAKSSMTQLHSMMPLQKAPPPYQNPQSNQQFTPVRQQQNPGGIFGRSQLGSCVPSVMSADQRNQGFFNQASQPQLQINQRGYISAHGSVQQPTMRRLQHMPLKTNVPFSGNSQNTNLTSLSDPYLPSVTLAGLKEERNIAITKNSDLSQCHCHSIPMEQDSDPFPSDLSQLELHDFSDRSQLQRDLESIIRIEMGDGRLDFEQACVNANPVSMSIAGQNWVH